MHHEWTYFNVLGILVTVYSIQHRKDCDSTTFTGLRNYNRLSPKESPIIYVQILLIYLGLSYWSFAIEYSSSMRWLNSENNIHSHWVKYRLIAKSIIIHSTKQFKFSLNTLSCHHFIFYPFLHGSEHSSQSNYMGRVQGYKLQYCVCLNYNVCISKTRQTLYV